MRILQTLLILFFSASLFAQEGGLTITHLTGDFYVYTTYGSYKGSAVPSNSMYLVTDSGVALFDTPWDTTQFQPLLDSIQARHHKKAVLCIATHSHKDRTAGLEFLKQEGVKTFTSKQTDEICMAKKEKRAEFVFTKDTIFTVGQYSFQTYYAGKGHTPDNIIIWFEKNKVLYGGCLIKSTEATGLGNIADASLKEWPATIIKIKHQFPHPAYIIPGHQSWESKNALNHTLDLLNENKKK